MITCFPKAHFFSQSTPHSEQNKLKALTVFFIVQIRSVWQAVPKLEKSISAISWRVNTVYGKQKPLEDCSRFQLRSSWQELDHVHTETKSGERMRIPDGFRSLMIPSRKGERKWRSVLPEYTGVTDTQHKALAAGRSSMVSATNTGNNITQANERSWEG